MDEQVVIGVDGGGTRLRAALVTVQGRVLGCGEAGSGNYHDVGAGEVGANIRRAVAEAWAAAQQSARVTDAIFLGLGSVVTSEDHEIIRNVVRDLEIVREGCIGVDHDLRVALAGGMAGRPGIVLIAGTGSSCYGRNERGQSWQAGGWGPLLDDLGSSHWLGLQAMTAAIRDHDGRGTATHLRRTVVEALGLSDIRDILRRVELVGMKRREIAALAHLVTEAATEGDQVAVELIERGVDELALMVATVAGKLGFTHAMQPIPVVVTGGLTNAGAVFMEPLARAIQGRIPAAAMTDAVLPPVLGAALLAMELVGTVTTPDTAIRMRESYSTNQSMCFAG